MSYRTLSCFEGFHCIGGACKDSCCVGWEIDVDEHSYQRYQTLEGAFGERLRNSIVTEEDGTHHYRLSGERCPFLNENGLCEQILTVGEGILCEICDQHPRFYNAVGEYQEMGYGLACEQVARMLLASDEPLTLMAGADVLENAEEDAEVWLIQSRDALIALAQQRDKSLYERLGLLLTMAESLQEQLDWSEWSGNELPEESAVEVTAGQGVLWLDWLMELDPIDEEWKDALQDTLSAAENPESFFEFCEEVEENPVVYEHLLVYLLFRYVLNAAKDDGILYWVQTAVLGVLTVEQLAFGRWTRNQGQISPQDWQDVLRIFSKELEYDPDIIENLTPLDNCAPFVE